MKQPVIAIIGAAGAVGSTTAYSLIMHKITATILAVDIKAYDKRKNVSRTVCRNYQ